MPSVEVQRTLVKSPPELWTELSDPSSLSRHLGELGEIRVTRVEPESAVEWEAENIRGFIQLKPSGWGTKVTLSVIRELPEPAAQEPEPEPEIVEPELVEPAEPAKAELVEPAEPELIESQPAEHEPAEPTPDPTPSPRQGFFSRLFRRRRTDTLAMEPDGAPTAEIEPPQPPEPEHAEEHEKPAEEHETPAEEHEKRTTDDRPDAAAELARVEQAMVEQDTALLSAVLNRLGAAHHRPFSRG
jgi:hypothetical protein